MWTLFAWIALATILLTMGTMAAGDPHRVLNGNHAELLHTRH